MKVQDLFRVFLRWCLIILLLAVVGGTAVAVFLHLLDAVTMARWQNEWLLYLLPLAGVVIYWLYHKAGSAAAGGNDTILREVMKPTGGVPAVMAPLVLFATLITHLFGGSAGREGTAVQMGGSIAGMVGRWLHVTGAERRLVLLSGIAAGFGAVFGTPIAGAIFALEVMAIGRLRYAAIIPCFASAFAAHFVCMAWGVTHTQYRPLLSGTYFAFSPDRDQFILALKVVVAGVAFGLVARLFAYSSHKLKDAAGKWYASRGWLSPVVGGLVVIAATVAVGSTDYLGLGVTTFSGKGASIVNAFHSGGVGQWSWLLKLMFTVVTLSMGFKGGEVTPLFFIGATLGSALSVWLNVPVELMAGIGFLAVFAGATNTPVASALMGAELFGWGNTVWFVLACFVARYASGSTSIYKAQEEKWSAMEDL
ncbi:MAG: chloride channel protein [Flavipsychrobacter sp.]|nr:chloride channel protein [Flavipsychrobacter sp.]